MLQGTPQRIGGHRVCGAPVMPQRVVTCRLPAAGVPQEGLERLRPSQVLGTPLRASAACSVRRQQSTRVHAVASPDQALPVILVAEKLGGAGLSLLEAYGTVVTAYGMKHDELLKKVVDADALIVRSATKVTRDVFEASNGRLKVVGRAGVGVDNVDLDAATEYGCLVVNAPTANTIAAAEHGIALIAALSRNVAQADRSVKEGKWERTKYVGVSLVNKVLAIIGFGKVGGEVARRAKGLGFDVIAYDPYASEAKAQALGVRLVSFDDALAQADFFSLHMPMTPDTKGMLGDAAFAKMKRGARVVNVARGGVIDEDALIRALDAGIVAQAALDVFEEEPPRPGNALTSREDVICTPHLGASTVEAQEDVAVEIADAVIDALKGELAATAVNAPMVPAEVLAELQPFVSLAQGLGRAAVQLVGTGGFTDVTVEYSSPRGDDLDTRLLRAMVVKGILEQITTANINLVNADLVAKSRGLRITESIIPSEGKDILTQMRVKLGTANTRFSAAVAGDGQITVTGAVKGTTPFLTAVGQFDVELAMEGIVLLVRQTDRPGIIAAVSAVLGSGQVNISFMTVCRTRKGQDAIMAIGVDERPNDHLLEGIPHIPGISEFAVLSEEKVGLKA